MGEKQKPLITKEGWHTGARAVCSPNADARPDGETVSLLVIHNISLPPGRFGGNYVSDFFTNSLDIDADPFFQEIESLRVSSHLFIDREGEAIQFVSFRDRAWHAGQSVFEGKSACNDFSIGIELEGTDIDPYTDNQYRSLAEMTHVIMVAYPAITLQRIVGHRDIAPKRKTDPGLAFDWQRYHQLLREVADDLY